MLSAILRTTLSKTCTSLGAVTAVGNPFTESMQIRCRSNRSRRGLYDGKDIRFGNKVSHSERKSRRSFKPNVFIKRLYSESLDEMIRFHVTTSALRTIDKYGGLDNYILRSRHVVEGEGLAAKQRILARQKEVEEANMSEDKIVEPAPSS